MKAKLAKRLSVLMALILIFCAVLPASACAQEDASAYYDRLESCVEQIRTVSDIVPEVVLVTASGLGYLADDLEVDAEIPYEQIEGFPIPTADGHEGKLILGTLEGVPVVVLSGRVHCYEGCDMRDVVFPLRAACMLGARTAILTTTAGAVNTELAPGDLVAVSDHIATFLPSPLIGPNIDALGERFVDMTQVYDEELTALVKQLGEEQELTVKDGVLIEVAGPQYETPAEIHMYEMMGVDIASMSTADEAIAARHMGMRVCAVALITNMAAGVEPRQIERADVSRTAAEAENDFRSLIDSLIASLPDTDSTSETTPVSSVEADGDTMKTVYFAAPLFSQSEKDFNLNLTNLLEEHGYKVFLPQRDGLLAVEMEGKTEEEKSRMIFEKDVSEVLKADILFMVLDGLAPDEGACVELGIAYANGKRCYGVKTDSRSVQIDLDINPMISGCLVELFEDYDGDSLIETLERYLSENEL